MRRVVLLIIISICVIAIKGLPAEIQPVVYGCIIGLCVLNFIKATHRIYLMIEDGEEGLFLNIEFDHQFFSFATILLTLGMLFV